MVKKGDLLVRLDNEELQLEVEAAKVRLDQARAEYEGMKRTSETPGFKVGPEKLGKAAIDLRLSEIEFKRLELRLARTEIRSPADGRVRYLGDDSAGGTLISVGKRVIAGDILLIVVSVEPAAATNEAPADGDTGAHRKASGDSVPSARRVPTPRPTPRRP